MNNRRNRITNAKGSNQFAIKKRKNVGYYLLGFIALMDILAFLYVYSLPTTLLNPSVGAASEKVASPAAQLVPKTVEQVDDPIEKDIKLVFGKYYPQASMLLDCENHARNPKAVNHNSDSIHSNDYGIFQINDHWQGVSNKAFLEDYDINIRIAYNIFSRDNYSFKLWTCGRKLGI